MFGMVSVSVASGIRALWPNGTAGIGKPKFRRNDAARHFVTHFGTGEGPSQIASLPMSGGIQ
jgi:hypothetical protein